MRANGLRSLSLALGALLVLGAAPPPRKAGPGSKQGAPQPTLPKVVLEELVDDRYGGGESKSGLIAVLKLATEKRDDDPVGRAFVKDARDDAGRSLLPEKPETPQLRDLGYSTGLLIPLVAPPRSPRTVILSGTVELFTPKLDPASIVEVPKAPSKLDVPLVSPGLAAARIQVTPLSTARPAEELKKQSGPEAMARFRDAMKAEGKTDEEISEMLATREALTKAFSSGESEHAVVLHAKLEDFKRIQKVQIVGPDGQEIYAGMSGGSDGVMTTRRYELRQAPDPATMLVFTLYTDRARVTVPFALKDVKLP